MEKNFPSTLLVASSLLAGCESIENFINPPVACDDPSASPYYPTEYSLDECQAIQKRITENVGSKDPKELEEALEKSNKLRWRDGREYRAESDELKAAQKEMAKALLALKLKDLDVTDSSACEDLQTIVGHMQALVDDDGRWYTERILSLDYDDKDLWRPTLRAINASQGDALNVGNLCAVGYGHMSYIPVMVHVDEDQARQAARKSFEKDQAQISTKGLKRCVPDQDFLMVKVPSNFVHEGDMSEAPLEDVQFKVCSKGDQVITVSLDVFEGDNEFFYPRTHFESAQPWMGWGRYVGANKNGTYSHSALTAVSSFQVTPGVPAGYEQTFTVQEEVFLPDLSK